MCRAAKVAIVEVEEIVPIGQLDPDEIHLPGVYVKRIIKGEKYEKRIEVLYSYCRVYSSHHFIGDSLLVNLVYIDFQRLTVQKRKSKSGLAQTPAAALRERIIRRAACEFTDGMYGILQIYIIKTMNVPSCWFFFKFSLRWCYGLNFLNSI